MKQRGLRKLVSMILAVVMAFAMSATVFAATITIENTTTDKTYTAYKIFDATGSGENVSYTIESDSVWYSTVKDAATEDGTSVFTLTQAGEGSTTYYVSINDGIEDADVIGVFASIPDGATVAASGTGNGGSVTLKDSNESEDIAAGYYYITTGNGTAITIDTTVTAVTVVDKNQTPGTDLEKTVSDTEAQIGDTVTYTITSNVPAYDGIQKIENYTFKDTLSDGLTAPSSSDITVTIKNSSGNAVTVETNVIHVTVEGQVITISYDPTEIADYPADATIKISYSAEVNANAAFENGNTVSQKWTGNTSGKEVTEIVYTYGFNLQKVDGEKNEDDTYNQLSGAKFRLYTTQTNGTAITFKKETDGDGNITYTVDPEGTVTEIEVGYATIKGLDADITYYLEETKAPAGYNMVGGRTAVTVGGSTTTGEGDEAVTTYSYNIETGINTETTTIENNAGSSLPSTGGIGTTIFYIVGGVLVLGAAVLFVTKKRLSNEN